MARMRFTGKIELAILAITLAVQVVKLVREHRRKGQPSPAMEDGVEDLKPIKIK